MSTRRMIDPAFWRSRTVGKLTTFQRLLFLGIISNADDQGRIEGEPALLRATIFPWDDVSLSDISNALQVLVDTECILLYEAASAFYIQVLNWWKYQHPQWAYPSRFPASTGWRDCLHYRQGNRVISVNWNDDDPDDETPPAPRETPLATAPCPALTTEPVTDDTDTKTESDTTPQRGQSGPTVEPERGQSGPTVEPGHSISISNRISDRNRENLSSIDSPPKAERKPPPSQKPPNPPSEKPPPAQSPLAFDTPQAQLLQRHLAANANARGYRSPLRFGSLEQKAAFSQAAAVLGEQLGGVIESAMKAQCLSVQKAVAYVSKAASNRLKEREEETRRKAERAELEAEYEDRRTPRQLTAEEQAQEEARQTWAAIAEELERQMTQETFSTWFANSQGRSLQDGTLTVEVCSRYAKDVLDGRLRATIDRVVNRIEPGLQVIFVAHSSAACTAVRRN